MNPSSYYITLSSLASGSYFKNSPSNFKVQLPQPLQLDGKWEVALVEITYQQTWHNFPENAIIEILKRMPSSYKAATITDKQFKLLSDIKKSDVNNDKGDTYVLVPVEISKGNYNGPGEIITEIANQAKCCTDFSINYDRFGKRMHLKWPDMIAFNKNDTIRRALGLSKPDLSTIEYDVYKTPLKGSDCFIPTIPALYVYGDMVEYSIVGDVSVPLLRTVPVTGEAGHNINHSFVRPYYIPVSRGYINSMEIQITSATGKEVQFKGGEVICVLHFRKSTPTL